VPLVARAQQPAIPVIGYLHPASLEGAEWSLAAFRQGLKEKGYVEGQNVAIEYRWAHGDLDRLPVMMADLVRSRVAVLMLNGTAARAIKAAQATGVGGDIPVVFSFGGDPVAIGLVASLNRPGGQITGTTSIGVELGPKRLELVRALVPNATTIAPLTNPTNPGGEMERRDIESAARALGWQLDVVHAGRASEFDSAFAMLVHRRIGALIISVDTFFYGEMARLASLAAQHAVPTIGPIRAFARRVDS
jgi:putative ABC transport system substrate-binding protein